MLLQFGHLDLAFDDTAFAHLRTVLKSYRKRYQWLLDALEELPSCFTKLQNGDPEHFTSSQLSSLQDLDRWMRHDEEVLESLVLPNILLNPLVVVSHMVQYLAYLETLCPLGTQDEHLYVSTQQNTETLGFCTGLLSAFAVSASANDQQLRRNATTSIRLAMLIGAAVDAQDRVDAEGPSSSFSAAWHSSEQRALLMKELNSNDSDKIYISVVYDENRVTITLPARHSTALQETLRSYDLTTFPVDLRGRFHWTGNGQICKILRKVCEDNADFQLPRAEDVFLPTRSNMTGKHISDGCLTELALTAILLTPAQWYQSFSVTKNEILTAPGASIVTFGAACIPPTLLRKQDLNIVHAADLGLTEFIPPNTPSRSKHGYAKNDIAVIGMSCKTPGADDLEQFWDLLSKGKSQHRQVPEERIKFETTYRSDNPERKWYGNFINDHDTFDHKFFKKSPRECAAQDPQQRQLLQAAYQAVEFSGYFLSEVPPDPCIGCYVGACAVDYEDNVAGYAPTAFTATGNLRGFIAGKVSHFFGWTGPSVVIDTACSSSTVAVHQACQSILNGDCIAALAAGTHVMTSPLWYQNLAGASFLSPTGACKPFDAKADGYCRGEAVAAVYLKRMDHAIADGNQILGTIAASTVQQNRNSTAIYVPNSDSLSNLFETVIHRSGLHAFDISFVEAHGTGTAVGDPAEYASVRKVLAGPDRISDLYLGSVKGLVGHSECTSGLVSLIKTLLTITKGQIPPQASFDQVSPNLKAASDDHIIISKRPVTWKPSYSAALINNYGASGSNASLVVTQAPSYGSLLLKHHSETAEHRYPFCFSAIDDETLHRYTSAMVRYLQSEEGQKADIIDISFNSFRQSNRELQRRLILSSKSKTDLVECLLSLQRQTPSDCFTSKIPKLPVILCFGGQVSAVINLDRGVYDNTSILREYLGQCDATCHVQRLPRILPDIFGKETVTDPVKLQLMLFSLQYACAKTWIDCGAEPVALVGHSFGELTALAVSGVLSLKDALLMVAGRSKVIRDYWGHDKGAMMAVEGDPDVVSAMLAQCNIMLPGDESATIGCFNGPRNFTLSGSVPAVEAVQAAITQQSAHVVKHQRLQVTNAFHSPLVDPLLGLLEKTAEAIEFREPSIYIERATQNAFTGLYTARFVADHMRDPVHFNDAVQRLHKRYSSAIWLEAGSASSVTNMASRALGSPSGNIFQGINITSKSGLSNLSDATLALWRAGLDVVFWPHHKSQTLTYKTLFLPPYQFHKSRHWMDMKPPVTKEIVTDTSSLKASALPPETMLTYMGHKDGQKTSQFHINTKSAQYLKLVNGHIIAHTAGICPAPVQLDLAIEALLMLNPDLISKGFSPQIQNVVNQSPLCLDPSRSTILELVHSTDDVALWSFNVNSNASASDVSPTTHTLGEIHVRHQQDPLLKVEFAQYERLSTHKRCLSLIDSSTAEDVIQGRNIYSVFASVVDYSSDYQGLKKIVGQGSSSAGRVVKSYNDKTWFDPYLSDCFAQVGGIWVNCMTEHDPSDIYIANGIEKWVRSPDFKSVCSSNTWDVLALHSGPVGKTYTTDVFVFDAMTGLLAVVILGVKFTRVSSSYMSKLLTRLTKEEYLKNHSADHSLAVTKKQYEQEQVVSHLQSHTSGRGVDLEIPSLVDQDLIKKSAATATSNYVEKVKTVLADISGIAVKDISDHDDLPSLGIDSLAGMELAKELEAVLHCTLPVDELMIATDVASLLRCIASVLEHDGIHHSVVSSGTISSSDEQEFERFSTGVTTPIERSIDTSNTTIVHPVALVANIIGMEMSEIKSGVLLRDLGLDSLLSMELRTDLESRYDLVIDDHFALEELDIDGIERLCGNKIPTKVSIQDQTAPDTSGLRLSESTLTPRLKDKNQLLMSSTIAISAFRDIKARTDSAIEEHVLHNYASQTLIDQTRLCVLLAVEALEALGCSLRSVKGGTEIKMVSCVPEHSQLVKYIYNMIASESNLIFKEGDIFVRSGFEAPSGPSQKLLTELNEKWPNEKACQDLTYYAGIHLPEILQGRADGVKLIFGSPDGRDLVSKVYGDWPMNKMFYTLMQQFLSRLVSQLPKTGEPLKILELGAGTGGTSKWLLPFLADLNYPVEYTFTDLGPSFVAMARKRFQHYPFVRFRTHDIEAEPTGDLVESQHVVIASNAIHATHNLVKSTSNVRRMLRPGGLLMMLEMTGTMYWCDMIFGLFEGWWSFSDGRSHAVASEAQWKKELQSAGYAHVDWTDGDRPENQLERLIIAVAPDIRYGDPPLALALSSVTPTDVTSRRIATDEYISQMTHHFKKPLQSANNVWPSERCVLLTGATGSLGSHLLECLAEDSSIARVICLNRRGRSSTAQSRQEAALRDKDIFLSPTASAKILVLEADSSAPSLGLSPSEYQNLVQRVTHIVHNAWMMNAKMPLKGFEDQFATMQNLIGLAHDIAQYRPRGCRVEFQFVSSIAVVGHYPRWKGSIHAPEQRMSIEAVLENGYGDAKFVCERMLDETLHKYPQYFKASSVRIGQIAGSRKTGYWNPMEHLSFLWKSSQTIGALPAFTGPLSWTSVDDVAGTLRDLLFVDDPFPIYHIDNPVRQSWESVLPILADALKVPRTNVVPFAEWIRRVRECPNVSGRDNPAIFLIDFLDDNFIRMSCGGLLLSTANSQKHSETLRAVGPVLEETILLFFKSWRDKKFLS